MVIRATVPLIADDEGRTPDLSAYAEQIGGRPYTMRIVGSADGETADVEIMVSE